VSAGDVIADVETDKATVGFEVQEGGYIAKILLPDGTKDVDVGTPAVIIVENKEDLAAFKDYKAGGGSKAKAEPKKEAPKETQKESSTSSNRSDLPSHSTLTMPALSPTMQKGNISKWVKQEGDQVSAGDVIADVETDKATVGFEVQEGGYIAKILLPDGTKDVDVGTPAVIIVENKEDLAAFKDYKAGGASKGAKKEAPKETRESSKSEESVSAGPTKSLPKHTKLTMPALSPTMQEGKIVSWAKQVGDKLAPGDVLADVETDKATVGFEMQEDGYLAKLLVEAGGTTIKVGDVVAIVVDEESEVKAFKDLSVADILAALKGGAPKSGGQPAKKEEPKREESRAESTSQQRRDTSSGERTKASPLARKIASENKFDISGMKGSGPGERVLKHDVETAMESKKAQAATQKVEVSKERAEVSKEKAAPAKQQLQFDKKSSTGNDYLDKPVTTMRKVIAERLLESKTKLPHYYLTTEVVMNNLIKAREELNKDGTVKISVNDFIIKACALALIEVPEVNAQWLGDTIRIFKDADISIAVDIGDGLITPIIPAANKKGLGEISSTMKDLASRAKNKKLKPHEYQGGTFSISNLGMLGVHHFSAVINPPQAAILAIGTTEKKIVPDEKNGFRTDNVTTVTLSCDHRAIDGAVGARWLQAFKKYIERPALMLL